MSALIQQIVTISGVVAGAISTFAVTSLTERSRWRRSQSTRWDDRRLVAYVEYASAVKGTVRLCYRIAVTKGILANGQPIDIESGHTALAEAGSERAAKWETVLVLGEPTAISAARAWHESVDKLELLIRERDVIGEDFIDAYKENVQLRDIFYENVRSDLGVLSGNLPEPTFRSLRLRD